MALVIIDSGDIAMRQETILVRGGPLPTIASDRVESTREPPMHLALCSLVVLRIVAILQSNINARCPNGVN